MEKRLIEYIIEHVRPEIVPIPVCKPCIAQVLCLDLSTLQESKFMMIIREPIEDEECHIDYMERNVGEV